MSDITVAIIEEALAAFQFLAGRGGLFLDAADLQLLRREIPKVAVSWRGGIRNLPSGGVEFVEAINCSLLDETAAKRVGLMLASAYLGFYDAAADGVALTHVDSVKKWYGGTLSDNYPEAGAAFLKFSTTYWTFKVLLRQLDLENLSPLVGVLLVRMDSFLGELFFPFDGPFKIDPAQREVDQRRFLNAFGPRINIANFLNRNPILIRDKKLFKKK
jgi:hypothetical protein